MKTIETATTPQDIQEGHPWASTVGWIALLLLINLGLMTGNSPASHLAFNPVAVGQGEWWRLFTGFFVHVSRYHLLLDGIAFILLYKSLNHSPLEERLVLLLGCAAGSLLLPLALDPRISQVGLCGLSGVAHGLMAIHCAEMLRNRRERALGGLILTVLLAKVGWELVTGAAFLQGMHLGNIGVPIVSTHAGGAAGGLLAWCLLHRTGHLNHRS